MTAGRRLSSTVPIPVWLVVLLVLAIACVPAAFAGWAAQGAASSNARDDIKAEALRAVRAEARLRCEGEVSSRQEIRATFGLLLRDPVVAASPSTVRALRGFLAQTPPKRCERRGDEFVAVENTRPFG